MDENYGLKPLEALPKEPPNSLNDLDYRLSMSLKQPDDNYVVDELFHNGTITIYALYDVDRKLTKPGNEHVGDGTDLLESEGDQRVHESTILYKNSHFKKFWKSTSKHVQGDKSEKRIQTDSEWKGKNSEDLKILYSRHLNNGGRRRNDNAIIKKKSGSGEILNDGRIVSNSAVKKFESNLVKVPEEPEVENKNVEDEISSKKNIHKPRKEFKFSEDQTDFLIDSNVQNCVLNDMKYLQLQINRIITKLEQSNGAVKSNSELVKQKSIQKQEITVRVSMEQKKSSVVLTGRALSISEEPKKSTSTIEIASRGKNLGGSKSESNPLPSPVDNSVKKCLSFDRNAKSTEINFKRILWTSVLISFQYQMTKALILLESYNECNKINIEEGKKTEDRKPGKIPILKHRNVLSKNPRLPWNSSTQKNDLARKSLINKLANKPPSRKHEIDSKQSINMETKKKSISTMKRTTDHIPSFKVIHSNRSYLELLKGTGTDEKCRRQVTPRTSCVRDKKSAKPSLREMPNSNYIILPHTVYEKVIFLRDTNSKDEVSSEFDESLSGKEPSCSCVLGSKSEESQPKVETTSKNEITLTGKQSLPEIKIRKKEFRNANKRGSDGFQKGKNNSVVRSIWALTKVLIFNDGTKKIDLLEASCTPLMSNLMQINKA